MDDSHCPACGKAVDPIRAGEVAILSGGFRYFCDRTCKVEFLGTLTRASLYDDGVTAEPPRVAVAGDVDEEEAAVRETMLRATRDSMIPPAPRRPDPYERETLPASLTEPPPPVATVLPDVELARDDRAEATAPLTMPPMDATERPPEVEGDEPADAERTERVDALGHTGEESSDEARETRDTEPPADDVTEDVPSAALLGGEDDEARRASRAPSAPLAKSGARAVSPRATRSDRARPSRTMPALRLLGIAVGVAPALVAQLAPSVVPLDLACAAVAVVLAIVVGTSPEGRLPGARGFREGILVLALLAALVARTGDAAESLRTGLTLSAGGLAAALLAGDLLFSRRRRRTEAARQAIAVALDVPVRVVRSDVVETVSPDRVKPGETVILSAGETCPVDGTVGGGEASVVPWLVLGSGGAAPESASRGEGDAIVAGAKVTSGSLRVTTAWTGNDRAFRKMTGGAGAVEQQAPLVRLATQILERGSIGVALFVGIGAYLTRAGVAGSLGAAAAAGGALAALAIVRAVAELHAEGHLASLGRGIVYKDALAFEKAGRADVAVVCAHGTLLLGDPEIVALETLGTVDEGRILALAAGAYSAAGESLAVSLQRAARARGQRPDDVRSAIASPGLGVSALAASGEKLIVGSRAFLLQEKVSVAKADARVSELEAEGRNVLLVALDQRLVGITALQDGLRPGAQGAIRQLHDARIEPVLLAGDARETCETVARALDLDHIRPEVLPADRGTEVRALGEGGHIVAVIGRPRDDDAALGAADVSIALGAAGSSPGEWSASLASEDVRDAALALALAHRVHERSRVAMIAGLVPAGAGLLAIAFALVPLWVAPLAAFAGSILAERVVAATTLRKVGVRPPTN